MTQPANRTVVLASGSGTNLQAIIDAQAAGDINVDLTHVISDVPEAYALERAREAGIEPVVVDRRALPDRDSFDAELAQTLKTINPDVIVLAGFMRILADDLVTHFHGRMLNVHPSLLPKFPGLNTYQRVLEAGDGWHGTTVHFVIPELDAGPPIVQYRVSIGPDDDEDSLRERVQKGEYLIYPRALGWLAEGRLQLKGDTVWLDGEALTAPVPVDEQS